MPDALTSQLSRRERQIMDVIYRHGKVTAAEVLAELPEPPSYSAVRAMLVKLEQKGFVRHRADGPRYVYSPTTSRTTARRSALQQLVRVFFSGSPGQAANALLKDENWSDQELDSLLAEIERVRNERRRS
jgi:predicted transcriptional regulator